MGEAIPPVLRTERLVLRDWVDADLAPFAQLNADPEVMRYFRGPLDQAQSDAMAARIQQRLRADGFGLWAVGVLGGAPFIGFVGLARQNFEAHFTPAIEVGWRLARESWGHGYAPEAARAVLDLAFGPLGLEQVVSMTSVGNANSRRVMEKLGLRRDPAEDFEHPALAEGHPLRPHVLYRVSARDWDHPVS